MRFYQFDEWEFYDLETDPDELTNRYGDIRYQDTIERMHRDLDALQEHYGDDSDVSVKPEAWQAQMREG